jgi:Type VI secretion system/phage-baseplate injector OB domain
MSETTKYYGKYRGVVINNVDPMFLARIQVQVADVPTLFPPTWAMPCLPVGGIQNGFVTVPPIGAGVWVEFEQGDTDYPIWVGCFWGSAAEVPALSKLIPPGVPGITMQTVLQNVIQLSDVPGPTGGIMLKSTTNASIIVNDTGIYIQNGKGASILLVGPTVTIQGTPVTINQGALVVT